MPVDYLSRVCTNFFGNKGMVLGSVTYQMAELLPIYTLTNAGASCGCGLRRAIQHARATPLVYPPPPETPFVANFATAHGAQPATRPIAHGIRVDPWAKCVLRRGGGI